MLMCALLLSNSEVGKSKELVPVAWRHTTQSVGSYLQDMHVWDDLSCCSSSARTPRHADSSTRWLSHSGAGCYDYLLGVLLCQNQARCVRFHRLTTSQQKKSHGLQQHQPYICPATMILLTEHILWIFKHNRGCTVVVFLAKLPY